MICDSGKDMMQDFTWSKTEKTCARRAFDRAYRREIEHITERVHAMLASNTDGRTIWRVHDYLSRKRKDTDHKYDYRYSVLISVFGRLLAESHLHAEDLEGLSEDKIERIQAIAGLMQEQ